jgi:hypothetical protein
VKRAAALVFTLVVAIAIASASAHAADAGSTAVLSPSGLRPDTPSLAPSASLQGARTSTSTSTPTPTSDGGADAGLAISCVENVPTGTSRPILSERFPSRGLTGYAAVLEITVFHGKGESVLPNGLAIRSESEAGQALKRAGFVFPHQDGSARAHIESKPEDPVHPGLSATLLSLPLLILPDEPGRHTLTLPPLPVAIARKNGDLATVCTHAHVIVVEDPIANTPDPTVAPNPRAEPQREEWTAMENAVKWIGIGLAVGIVAMWLTRWWRSRPKPLPPPPPPRPPWEIALEKLAQIRRDDLLEKGRFAEHFDRVSDAVREYLGGRFGFDGLESTTDEILAALKKRAVSHTGFTEITSFLGECDLVKFANIQPSKEECEKILEFGVSIVHTTTPARDMRPLPSASAEALR